MRMRATHSPVIRAVALRRDEKLESVCMYCSISIDLDSSNCYRAIHGLPFVKTATEDPIFTKALPRFLDVCSDLGIKATLFTVGSDLDNPQIAQAIRQAHQAGHEIASHSHSHNYSLSRWDAPRIDEDLAAAEAAILRVCGQKPVGFRAPGYNQSETLFDVLDKRGYQYDSSFFPTPSYYLARAVSIGLYKLRGRQSRSLVGDVREFLAPRHPFYPHTSKRFTHGTPTQTRSFLEIPISVASIFRLPWLGTSVSLFPDAVSHIFTQQSLHKKHQQGETTVFELHAIDFADASDGYEPALIKAQPDLQVPLVDKMRRLRRALQTVATHAPTLTLADLSNLSVYRPTASGR